MSRHAAGLFAPSARMSEHISVDLALFVMSLAADHPERRAAVRHARDCPACSQLLAESRALLTCAPEPLDPRLKQRLMRALPHQPQHGTRVPLQLQLTLGLCASVALACIDSHARHAHTQAQHGLFAAHGHWCVFWELVGALAGMVVWRVVQQVRPARAAVDRTGRAALSALLGSLAVQVWLRARCPAHHAGLHLLAFHVLGVVLAALVGLLTGSLHRTAR